MKIYLKCISYCDIIDKSSETFTKKKKIISFSIFYPTCEDTNIGIRTRQMIRVAAA